MQNRGRSIGRCSAIQNSCRGEPIAANNRSAPLRLISSTTPVESLKKPCRAPAILKFGNRRRSSTRALAFTVNARARVELRRRFPNLRIAGARHGFFKDSTGVVDEINRSGADLLFAAMGSPRQEFWIAEHRPMLRPRFCMGVGGSLDVVAGVVKRAPAVFQKTGTEWLFRLVSDPRRARRQLALPLFALDVLKAAVAQQRHLPAH